MIYIIALISIFLGSVAQFLLKKGMLFVDLDGNIKIIIKQLICNYYLLGGVLCYIISLFFWIFVLSKLELSKAYPMVSLGYVFTLILGYALLNEEISFFKILGIILIILGVSFITKG